MKKKEMLNDEYLMLKERLREIDVELAMDDAGWGPYLEDIKVEREEIIKKINHKEWK
jgi:hypothetical protein